jgi:hypothetical protein
VSTKEQLVLPFPAGPFPGVPFPPVEDDETGVRGDDHVSASEGRSGDGPAAKAQPIPQNRRELALAIFAQCDPVALGRAILQNGDDRGASVRLRGLEMFTEWAYGKEDAEVEPAPTRVIWDLPRHGERCDGAGSAGSEPAGGGER